MADLSIAFRQSENIDALRDRLSKMSGDELLAFGWQMHELVYPLRYGFDGKPVVCWFSIQLDEARKEWRRRRHPKTAST
jgi:hypothetical protein